MHGEPPYRIVVVHGGPGAPGSAFGIVKGLAGFGAREPFQTSHTLEGQIHELARTVEEHADPPVTLIGHSWGAMLVLLTAAEHPNLVRKAILVCSGGLTAESYAQTNETRLSRLSRKERVRAEQIRAHLKASPDEEEPGLLFEYHDLISKADAFDPDPSAEDGCVGFQNAINKSVWAEAVALRESGELLRKIANVRCPVVAIHGDHDPHPAGAVKEPLETLLADFRFVRLSKCGHEPWKERQARDDFFRLMQRELNR